MQVQDNVVVFPESDEAAKFMTLTGWVSRDGRFFGNDERTARYAGSTHDHCATCGAMVLRGHRNCSECLEKQGILAYHKMPTQVFDGSTILYSDALDRYFMDLYEVEGWLADQETPRTLADLRLIICNPVMAHQLESDIWCDELPDEEEIPEVLADALAALNKVIEGLPPLSYVPGKYAVDLTRVAPVTAEKLVAGA